MHIVSLILCTKVNSAVFFKESLLELKKQRLLRMLHGYSVDAIPSPKCPPEVDQDSGASGSGFVDSSTPSSVDPVSQCEQESEDDLQGMKCQAPLKEVRVNTISIMMIFNHMTQRL